MKSALVIIFNQDYSTNIPKLEAIYQGRFSSIIYLVPDHSSRLDGLYVSPHWPILIPRTLDRIISLARRLFGRQNPNALEQSKKQALGKRFHRVIGHQFYFYDFVTQAADHLLELDVDWYWIVGDDAILNPTVNECSLLAGMDSDEHIDAILCRPVIGSDEWLEKIEGSVVSGAKRLQAALGTATPYCSKIAVEPEAGAENNREIAVACADCFGLSKSVLGRVVPLWQRCFARKLYVEVGLPNALLKAAKRPVATSNFYWQRIGTPEEGKRLITKLLEPTPPLFVHPIKLSVVEDRYLSLLSTGRRQNTKATLSG